MHSIVELLHAEYAQAHSTNGMRSLCVMIVFVIAAVGLNLKPGPGPDSTYHVQALVNLVKWVWQGKAFSFSKGASIEKSVVPNFGTKAKTRKTEALARLSGLCVISGLSKSKSTAKQIWEQAGTPALHHWNGGAALSALKCNQVYSLKGTRCLGSVELVFEKRLKPFVKNAYD